MVSLAGDGMTLFSIHYTHKNLSKSFLIVERVNNRAPLFQENEPAVTHDHVEFNMVNSADVYETQ